MLHRKLTRREFLRTAASWALGASLAGLGGFGYARGLEPDWLEVRRVRLSLPRLDARFHGYRLAQISDLHLGDWLDRTQLEEVVALVNKQQPDLIAITGDFVTHHAESFATDLVAALNKLSARDGVVAVLGNHDHWSNPDTIRQVLLDSGIFNVSNGARTLERGKALFHVAGVDDVWKKQDRLDVVLGKLPAEGAAILLAHEPDFADTSAATGRFDMQISGHSHGGQIVIPFLGPPVVPPLAKKYPLGLYKVGTMFQYTNRGVGMVRPHLRFNCRPEVTVFTLESSA